MPRLARTVFAGIPHHITQRGNRREDIFFTDEDRNHYLDWLKVYSQKHGVDILAYCLMTNHVHLVAIPQAEDSLQRALKPLHMRYAQMINRKHSWNGHLWQGRFFSSPLDLEYLWAAIRYVERNPVRARIVKSAEQYPWSSAAAHCQLTDDIVLTRKAIWLKQIDQIADWRIWLAEEDMPDKLDVLRRHTNKGLPCGSKSFVTKLEKLAGRTLQSRPPGRPKNQQE